MGGTEVGMGMGIGRGVEVGVGRRLVRGVRVLR